MEEELSTGFKILVIIAILVLIAAAFVLTTEDIVNIAEIGLL